VVSCRSARCVIWILQTVHSRGGAFGTLFLGIASRRGLQCTPKQFVVLWFVHGVRRIAINAAKLTSAGFHQHESHWSAALFAGGRWRVLGHRVARAGSGGSTKLSVTDNYRSWAMIIQHAHFGSKIASQFRMITLLRFMFQPGYEALAAPKLDCAAICKPFGFSHCFIVVSTS